MGYRTVLIRNSDKLRLYLDNIIIDNNDNEVRFLISDLKILIIDNYKATLSVQLINKLIDNNVTVIVSDLSHNPNCQILPLNGYYASSGELFNQINWSESIKMQLHREIVKSKIISQVDILRMNNKNNQVINRMIELSSEVVDGDLGNREGIAAKMYFRELFGSDFIRFDDDIFNAGMNYGYAVLRSLISSIVISKGLLPNLGIFHKGKTNSFNLSDDIIEVYRPLVDDWVYNNLNNKELLTTDDKNELIRLLDRKIEINGQLFTVPNNVELYLESIIKCLDTNDISFFSPPSLKKIHDL